VVFIWFNKLRLGVCLKLLSAFVLVALFTGLLGWYAVATMEKLNGGQRTTYHDVFGGTHLLATWLDRAWDTRRATFAYALAQKPEERLTLRQQMVAGDRELEQIAAEIDAVDSDRAEVDALERVVASWHNYAQWRDAALADADAANDPTLVVAEYQTEGARLDSDIDAAIDAFLESKGEAGGRLEQAAQITYENMRQLSIALSAGAVAVALAVGLFISRNIAGVARQVAEAADGLSRGELDQRIEVASNDELGQMALSFRSMIVYQQDMARVANAIAQGDLTQNVEPKSGADLLGNAFRRMSDNLRQLVSELQCALEQSRTLLIEKDGYAATVRHQVLRLSRLLQENATLHDRLRQAAVRTATLNEQGLRRIGADLHDGPCQSLAFALLRLDAAAVGKDSSETIRAAVRDALSEIRSIAAGLRLPELADLSLTAVVQRAIRDHERRSETSVQMEIGDLSTDAAVSVKVALFRALQEALSNATRHGRGEEVTVRAWLDEDWLWLSVADRGPGFVAAAVESKGQLGLASIRERAELLGGQFQVSSAPGCGTVVQLCWPLSPASCPQTDEGEVDPEICFSCGKCGEAHHVRGMDEMKAGSFG
jgi:signal transduction histidine kinase